MTVILHPTTAYFGETDSPGSGNLAQDTPSHIVFRNGDHIVFRNNDHIVFHETYTGSAISRRNKTDVPRTVYSGEVEL